MKSRARLSHHLLVAAALGLTTFAISDGALAQSYPSRPVRMVVGAAPGGAADAFARITMPPLAELLGQQVVIDNRPGASSNIAHALVARAQPDGYTLCWLISNVLTVNPHLYKTLSFEPQKDFALVLLIGSVQLILVEHRSVQANSVRELIALVKASKPGQFKYASGGIGTPNHLPGALFFQRAGLDVLHVPYKGGGPATVAVLSGETNLFFATLASVLQHMKTGALKALAVTGPKRSAEAPDIPTMQESGFPGFDVRFWHGVLAPAGTPKPILASLSRDLARVLSAPNVQEALKLQGLEQSLDTPKDFDAYIKSETALWGKVIKDAGITPE